MKSSKAKHLRQSLKDSTTPDVYQTKLCIVGGGVAGQTLARELSKHNIDTLIVESGGVDFRKDTQDLARGENIGEEYYSLESSRLRLFGGTAAIWGGRCAELDPIDFEKRDFLPYSGWPFTKAELDPYYSDVFKHLGLKRPGEGRLKTDLPIPNQPFDQQKIDTDFWAFDEKGERFTNLNSSGLDRTRILLNANITSVELGTQGDVLSMTARSLNGRKAIIKATYFVIAAGAIETTRLLMAAVPSRPNGFGNQNGVLGRFFMEHPHARGGQIHSDKLSEALMLLPRALRIDGRRYAGYARAAPTLQRKTGILNSSISIAPRRVLGQKPELFRRTTNHLKHNLPSTRVWRSTYKFAKGLAIKGLEKTDPWSSVMNMKFSRGKIGIFAVVRAEQAPNPNSRITLSEQKDSLGMRQVKLDWQFSDIDKKSVRILMKTLNEEFQRLNLGSVSPSQWLSEPNVKWQTDSLISAHPIGGYHHMGGTRMSETSSTGVVDSNCKLFESPNLFIASSSVFPTSGWANPTITIMAMAKRLGNHIAKLEQYK